MQDTGNSKRHIGGMCTLIIVCWIVFAPSMRGSFVWDDYHLVVNNQYIRSGAYIPRIVTQDMGAGAGQVYHFYRPLPILSYMADYAVWRNDARGYHVTSMMLHIGVVLCVYWFVMLVSQSCICACVSALLFGMHPVGADTVGYISNRADILAALGMVLSCIMSVLYMRRRRMVFLGLLAFFCACALLSKENALVLSLVVWAVYWFERASRVKMGSSVPHAQPSRCFVPGIVVVVIVSLYVAARLTLLRSIVGTVHSPDSFMLRVPGFFAALFGYVRMFLVPYGMRLDYGMPLFAWFDWRVVAGVGIAGALCVYAWRVRNKYPLISFGLVWFGIGLMPVNAVYPQVSFYMSCHYAYFPYIGLAIASAGIFRVLYKKYGRKALISVCVLVVFFSASAVARNSLWGNPLVLLAQEVQRTPESARLQHVLGFAYYQKKLFPQAAITLRDLITRHPNYPDAYNALALVYRDTYQYAEAMAVLEAAVERGLAGAQEYNNLAVLYVIAGRCAQAHQACQQALAYSKGQKCALIVDRCGVLPR